jgi:small subunit ribosomal protein S9
MSESNVKFLGTGRRKTAVARVYLSPGTGNITVNNKPVETYLYTEDLLRIALSPLALVGLREGVDIFARVEGGGATGQAGALLMGIARALQNMDPELRAALKKAGYLRRDPRMKERKKPGQPGARKRFQFSKR